MRAASRAMALGPAAALVTALALTMSVDAQQAPTFRSGTLVVSLFATVTDGQNRLVPDLAQENFEVLDNEKPQPLVVFRSEVQPITVVVMLDTSGSMTGTISLLKAAAEQFLIRLRSEERRVGKECRL